MLRQEPRPRPHAPLPIAALRDAAAQRSMARVRPPLLGAAARRRAARAATPPAAMEPDVQHLIGQAVVIDTTTRFMYLGILRNVNERWIELEDAEVVDTEQIRVSPDLLLIEKKRDGVKVGRRRIVVRLPSIISLSALDDICGP